MAEDKRRQVYDMLVQRTGYQDSYEKFSGYIDNPEKRRLVYDMLVQRSGYQDSYDKFERYIMPQQPTQTIQQQTPAPAPPRQAVLQSVYACLCRRQGKPSLCRPRGSRQGGKRYLSILKYPLH